MPSPIRRLFPPAGLRYRLFDSGVFVALLAALWYITTNVSGTTTEALSQSLFVIFVPTVWGIVLCTASVFACVCSYLPQRWLLAGFMVLGGACAGWSTSLLIGVILTEPPWQMAGKTLGSALIFAWVARGLIAEVLAYSDTAEQQ